MKKILEDIDDEVEDTHEGLYLEIDDDEVYIKKKIKHKDSITKKIQKMYSNYGMDTSGMSDDEFQRIREMYLSLKKDIDSDLKNSEKFKDVFSEDIL